MKDFLQPILDLVKALIQPSQGTKFLVTLCAIAAIVYLHSKGIATTTATIVIGVMPPVYYIADIIYKMKLKTGEPANGGASGGDVSKVIVSILIGALVLASPAMAQVVDKPQVLAGVQYDKNEGVGLHIGAVQNLGGPLFIAEHGVIGQYGQGTVTAMLLVRPKPGFWLGPLLGPGVDITSGETPLTYITAAAGGIATIQWGSGGIYGYGKYNFAVDEDAQYYVDGWQIGGGITLLWTN